MTRRYVPYYEKLKHPKWQERRLRMLESAGFQCTDCGDKESPLHVHHRVYIKGRDPWEYADNELVVLCEKCHEGAHLPLETIHKLLASSDPYTESDAAALIAGFVATHEAVDPGLVEQGRQLDICGAYFAGRLAAILCAFSPATVLEICAVAEPHVLKGTELRRKLALLVRDLLETQDERAAAEANA